LAEITWTRESEIWLEDIYSYIAAENPDAAAKTISKIYEKVQLLRNHPRLGHKYEPVGVFHGALDIDGTLYSSPIRVNLRKSAANFFVGK